MVTLLSSTYLWNEKVLLPEQVPALIFTFLEPLNNKTKIMTKFYRQACAENICLNLTRSTFANTKQRHRKHCGQWVGQGGIPMLYAHTLATELFLDIFAYS